MQFGDLVEFCDFDYIARATKVNVATLYSLAQAPGTPKDVGIETTALTNLSTLEWTRGNEPTSPAIRWCGGRRPRPTGKT